MTASQEATPQETPPPVVDPKSEVTEPKATDGEKWSGKLWATLIVLCSAMFLDALDNAMVGIAVPPIQQELGMSTSSVQWVVSAYVLGFGGFLLLGGRMADLVGRRKVFLVAVAIFGIASLIGGLATDGFLVIAARFVMGVAAAFTAPAGLAIILTQFPEGSARNKAVAIYTACGAFGFSLGLVAGGLLTEIGWRWTFLLPVPIALAILVGASVLVRKDEAATGKRHYDIPGAISVTGAMLLLVFTIVRAPEVGWVSAQTLLQFAGVIVLVVAFVLIERNTANPLIRLGFLRNGGLIGAALTAAAILGTYMSFQFIGSLYLQDTRGWSPLEMALAFLPCGILIAIIAPRAGGLLGKFGPKWMMFAGFVAYTLAYISFLRIDTDSSYVAVLLPTMLLIGVAFPLSFTGSYVQATSGVADSEQGLAAGVLQTGYQVGAALLLAVVTATMAAGQGGAGATNTIDSYHNGMYVITGVSALTLLATLVSALRKKRADA
ncbi:MFS transporter [Actinokineospora globicatena]|uniref:MFS transporter n=1 Tax=Actinokineospora globicatena TaxID=103729 RepID=UPI0020A3CBFB|nr:MFS transporter [Actinokineospora globicatena]MCP2302862.1 putative arabinose efflux permease, MFS family [Actinokineospora globicatena]